MKTVLREHRAASVLVALMTWVLSTAIVVVILFTPSYLQKASQIPATLTVACVAVGWGGLAVTTYLPYLGLPGTLESLVLSSALGFLMAFWPLASRGWVARS